ncbi:MAG: imidazolonepropionase [Fimbriimonadaceae bacterium]
MLLVTNIGQLLTIPPGGGWDLGMLHDAAMLIREGHVKAVGPRAELEPFAAREGCEVLDAGGRVVIPGLVDCHTHLVYGGNRNDEFEMKVRGESYESIAATGGGIRSSVRQTREASFKELLEQSRRRMHWCLLNGITTLEIKTGYGLSVEAELKMLSVIEELAQEGPQRVVATLLAAHAVPPEFGSAAGYFEAIVPQLVEAAAGRVEAVDIFVEQGYFNDDHAEALAVMARERGLALRLHVDQLHDARGAALAAKLYARSADHLEQTSAQGIEALAGSGVVPVLLPTSVLCLFKDQYPDARAMIEAGLPVVLASDYNPGSSPCCSLFVVMSLASTRMRMSPAECLVSCTRNAARVLGREGLVGTLAPGAVGDFVLLDCSDYRDAVVQLGAPLVDQVYISGHRVASR